MLPLTITACSSALFSSWFFLEELGVLLDAGDGVSAGLMQNSRKVKHVFVTHADRDHMAGLLQFHQLNAREGVPAIYYPKDCGSFPALKGFVEKFDPESGPATWRGLVPGETVKLEKGITVQAESSGHIATPDHLSKALRFVIRQSKRTLRREYQGMCGPELVAIKQRLGPESITEEVTEGVLGYSGDSPELDPADWSAVPVLIHECTFLESGTARRAHANLPEVLEASRTLKLEALILAHFSARYRREEIHSAVFRESSRLNLAFPVHVVVPGEVGTDILRGRPVWPPVAA